MPPVSYSRACGLDFGTSNSTAAHIHSGHARLLPLEDGKITLPSVVFFNAEDSVTRFGRAALNDYLAGHEGRLMRSLKSLLGSSLIQGQTEVHGRALRFQDLLGQFIAELKRRADKHSEHGFEQVVLGRPVHFVDDDPGADKLAENTLAEIARAAGFKDVSFQYEPIAAAFHYETTLQREALVLVADIGGGTSDFSLIRLSPERAKHTERSTDVLASAGVHIGGTDFDRQLSLSGVMPLFGFGSQLKSGKQMPSNIFFNLATWHTINAAYTRQVHAEQRELVLEAAEPAKAMRLLRLIETCAGHRLANDVEQAKIVLSDREQAQIELGYLEEGLQQLLLRSAFEMSMESLVSKVAGTVSQLLRDAGIAAAQVDTVLFTGGSSGIPRLRREIAGLLPQAQSVECDLFGSIGSGLAVEAGRRYS